MTEQPTLNVVVEEDASPEDAIDAGDAELHKVLAKIESLLRTKSGRVFRRYDELIRVCQLEKAEVDADGVRRHAGLSVLRSATAPWMAIEASRVGGVFVQHHRGKEKHRVPPPTALFGMLRDIADETTFPALHGIAMTPTLHCDRPGYDSKSKLFLSFPEGMFPPGPARLLKKHAQEALARLEHPLRGFPFESDADKSVALSAMISAVVRGDIPVIPMHLFDAPQPGTGKTKLAEIVGIMGAGVRPSGIAYTTDADENEKRLMSVLRTGDPVVNIDNISSYLEGDFLCQVITQESVQGRILGKSETVRLATNTLLIGTGNNIAVRGDLCRRVVRCRLNANVEDPEEREFDFDAVEEVLRDRPQLVTDALTIMRAYLAAKKRVALPAFGGFEKWSVVRGALVWLGRADPADTRREVKSNNAEFETRADFLRMLHKEPGLTRGWFKAGDLEQDCYHNLRNRMGDLLPGGKWNKRSLAWMLRKHKDIPTLGLTLRARDGGKANVKMWKVEGELKVEESLEKKGTEEPF